MLGLVPSIFNPLIFWALVDPRHKAEDDVVLDGSFVRRKNHRP